MLEIKDILKEEGIDGIIITSSENIYYFSGFTGGEGFAVLTADKNYILVDGRYTIQAKEQAKGFEVIEFKKAPYEHIEKLSLKNAGFEEKAISYYQYNNLCNNLKATKLKGVSDLLSKLRQVKRQDEIDNLRQAEKIGDMAFEHILRFIRPNISEREIALELEYFMKKNGADGLSFDTIVAVGSHSALPHARPTNAVVETGKVVLMDYGCIYNGYCSDMTRTVAVGNVDDKTKNIYDIVLDAQISALKSIKSGVNAKDVDKVARDIITSNGYGENFNHSLGHGVGLQIHEQPNLSYSSSSVLQEGNVVTVEPGIYIEGFCGIRIEDMVLVTTNNCENFTHSTKDFIIL